MVEIVGMAEFASSPGDRASSRDLGRLLGWLLGTKTWLQGVLVLGLLALAWVFSYTVGGAGSVAPHVFYVPIIVAAARFGWMGAALAGAAAGLLAGPLLPLNVTAGTAQALSDWASRLGFFVAIGLTGSAIFFGTRRIEERLGDSRRTLATLLANLPGMAYRGWAVPERTMEFVSGGARDLTGYAPAALFGGRATSFGDLIHPEDRDESWDSIELALAADRPFQITYRLTRADGDERWIREQGRGVASSDGLPGVIEGFATDVTHEKRAEEQRELGVRALTNLLEERRRLLMLLVSAQEDERRRIAGDLHDDSLQAMTALSMRFGILARELTGTVDGERLRELEAGIGDSIRGLRALMFELHPPELDRHGLVEAIRITLERLSEDLGAECVLEGELEEEPTGDVTMVAFRIAQEALVNVRKHSRARRVLVTVGSAEGGIRVRIEDDGVGFEAGANPAGLPGHLGLPSMRERARLIGGRCSIDSAPASGTIVDLWLPTGGQPEPTEPPPSVRVRGTRQDSSRA